MIDLDWLCLCIDGEQDEFSKEQMELELRMDDDDYSRRHEAAKLTQLQNLRELEYAKKVRLFAATHS